MSKLEIEVLNQNEVLRLLEKINNSIPNFLEKKDFYSASHCCEFLRVFTLLQYQNERYTLARIKNYNFYRQQKKVSAQSKFALDHNLLPTLFKRNIYEYKYYSRTGEFAKQDEIYILDLVHNCLISVLTITNNPSFPAVEYTRDIINPIFRLSAKDIIKSKFKTSVFYFSRIGNNQKIKKAHVPKSGNNSDLVFHEIYTQPIDLVVFDIYAFIDENNLEIPPGSIVWPYYIGFLQEILKEKINEYPTVLSAFLYEDIISITFEVSRSWQKHVTNFYKGTANFHFTTFELADISELTLYRERDMR